MEATDEISVRLTAAEWNQAIAILAEGPYRVVAPLLTKIQKQAMAQDPAALPVNGPDRESVDVSH